MPSETIGVDRMDRSNDDMCVVHFTNQTSLTMTASELADCIIESPRMQQSPPTNRPVRRYYMKEWPGRL